MHPSPLTVLILTYNEEKHIRRCLDNVRTLASRIIVIDSQSTDGTLDICRELGVEVVQHPWPGHQAAQFNWALDNLTITTDWILRLDADEYLLPELIDEIRTRLPQLPADVNGVILKRRHIFMGRWMRHGVYPICLLRLFRTGFGRYDGRIMDEHISLTEGRTVQFEHDFCDHSLINLSDYCHKHVNYAVREAAMALDADYDEKLSIKRRYYRLPLFWRSFAYFLYRYILRGGFLDGKEGFLFTFIQGWWYRTLVDAKIFEIRRATGGNRDQIRRLLADQYHITL